MFASLFDSFFALFICRLPDHAAERGCGCSLLLCLFVSLFACLIVSFFAYFVVLFCVCVEGCAEKGCVRVCLACLLHCLF